MTNRTKSWIAFLFAVVTAVTATCIVLYSLMTDLTRSQTLLLLAGCLIVVWAILFSFLEVRSIAAGPKNLANGSEVADPDGPRRIIVGPPTGEPYPHHESHVGSSGQDQGQLTSRLPDDTPAIRELLRRRDPKKQTG